MAAGAPECGESLSRDQTTNQSELLASEVVPPGRVCFTHHIYISTSTDEDEIYGRESWIFSSSCARSNKCPWVSPLLLSSARRCQIFLDAVARRSQSRPGHELVEHIPMLQLSLALMDLACSHPLASLITLSRDLLSPTIKLMNLAV